MLYPGGYFWLPNGNVKHHEDPLDYSRISRSTFRPTGLSPINLLVFPSYLTFIRKLHLALSLRKGPRDTVGDPMDLGFVLLRGDSLTSSHGVTLGGSLFASELP
jgi:hypothetical protein